MLLAYHLTASNRLCTALDSTVKTDQSPAQNLLVFRLISAAQRKLVLLPTNAGSNPELPHLPIPSIFRKPHNLIANAVEILSSLKNNDLKTLPSHV